MGNLTLTRVGNLTLASRKWQNPLGLLVLPLWGLTLIGALIVRLSWLMRFPVLKEHACNTQKSIVTKLYLGGISAKVELENVAQSLCQNGGLHRNL